LTAIRTASISNRTLAIAILAPPNSDYYAWFTQSSKGISNFSSTVGGNMAAIIPPKPSADIQAGGLSPNGPITLRGTIVC
jgi:hypothetical protein